jgi:hypothetical protein
MRFKFAINTKSQERVSILGTFRLRRPQAPEDRDELLPWSLEQLAPPTHWRPRAHGDLEVASPKRIKTAMTKQDVRRFKQKLLDPNLQALQRQPIARDDYLVVRDSAIVLHSRSSDKFRNCGSRAKVVFRPRVVNANIGALLGRRSGLVAPQSRSGSESNT